MAEVSTILHTQGDLYIIYILSSTVIMGPESDRMIALRTLVQDAAPKGDWEVTTSWVNIEIGVSAELRVEINHIRYWGGNAILLLPLAIFAVILKERLVQWENES